MPGLIKRPVRANPPVRAVRFSRKMSKPLLDQGVNSGTDAPMTRGKVALDFEAEVTLPVRLRMAYAFRVFSAIYGYEVVSSAPQADVCCVYGARCEGVLGDRIVRIPARYRVRSGSDRAPLLSKIRYANENFYLAHGRDPITGHPDWLGEIFEWLSAGLEMGIRDRDHSGRIPFAQSIFATQKVPVTKPHASLLMAWLENVLRNENRVDALPKAPSPVASAEHMVVCSHDIDYCFTSRRSALARLGKNMAVAVAHYRSRSFFRSNSQMVFDLLRGGKPGHYVPQMLDAIEKLGFRTTLFAVANGQHRRDPDYRIREIVPQLTDATRRGFSVGLHGSYSSVMENGSLSAEAAVLSDALGRRPQGNRQHWLRFDAHDQLIEAVNHAELAYDSSLGFAETCGFRNGASFAFPPYDIRKEKACGFLEIPLVIMDGSVALMARELGREPQELSEGILAESRKWGWGGIAILWHNPMEALQVPENINSVFWKCAKQRAAFAEQWMSAEQFVAKSLPRYQAAGLLKEIRFDAPDAN